MAEFVLDSGVALAWSLKESAENRRYALAVHHYIREAGAIPVIPAFFDYEVGSVLLRARRDPARRFSEVRLKLALDRLEAIPFRVAHLPVTARRVVELGKRYNLQGYDAMYFHLAQTMAIPIASIDGGIRHACLERGVGLLTF